MSRRRERERVETVEDSMTFIDTTSLLQSPLKVTESVTEDPEIRNELLTMSGILEEVSKLDPDKHSVEWVGQVYDEVIRVDDRLKTYGFAIHEDPREFKTECVNHWRPTRTRGDKIELEQSLYAMFGIESPKKSTGSKKSSKTPKDPPTVEESIRSSLKGTKGTPRKRSGRSRAK